MKRVANPNPTTTNSLLGISVSATEGCIGAEVVGCGGGGVAKRLAPGGAVDGGTDAKRAAAPAATARRARTHAPAPADRGPEEGGESEAEFERGGAITTPPSPFGGAGGGTTGPGVFAGRGVGRGTIPRNGGAEESGTGEPGPSAGSKGAAGAASLSRTWEGGRGVGVEQMGGGGGGGGEGDSPPFPHPFQARLTLFVTFACAQRVVLEGLLIVDFHALAVLERECNRVSAGGLEGQSSAEGGTPPRTPPPPRPPTYWASSWSELAALWYQRKACATSVGHPWPPR